jgi:hypothetical protein
MAINSSDNSISTIEIQPIPYARRSATTAPISHERPADLEQAVQPLFT